MPVAGEVDVARRPPWGRSGWSSEPADGVVRAASTASCQATPITFRIILSDPHHCDSPHYSGRTGALLPAVCVSLAGRSRGNRTRILVGGAYVAPLGLKSPVRLRSRRVPNSHPPESTVDVPSATTRAVRRPVPARADAGFTRMLYQLLTSRRGQQHSAGLSSEQVRFWLQADRCSSQVARIWRWSSGRVLGPYVVVDLFVETSPARWACSERDTPRRVPLPASIVLSVCFAAVSSPRCLSCRRTSCRNSRRTVLSVTPARRARPVERRRCVAEDTSRASRFRPVSISAGVTARLLEHHLKAVDDVFVSLAASCFGRNARACL